MAMNNLMRSYATKLLHSSAGRGFHATGVKIMSERDLHAEHMYNLDRIRFRKLTTILGVFTVFSICVSVPIVIFQQKKTASTAEGTMQKQ